MQHYTDYALQGKDSNHVSEDKHEDCPSGSYLIHSLRICLRDEPVKLGDRQALSAFDLWSLRQEMFVANLSWPNRVTITRVLLIVPFVLLLLYQNKPGYDDLARYLAMSVFAIMAFSDALDGYLARRTGQRSRLGYFLDPMADKLLITAACILLATKSSGVKEAILPGWVVVIIIGKDVLWLAGVLIIQFVTGRLTIRSSKLGRASTVAQLSMVLGILLSPDISLLSSAVAWWLTRVLWWSAAGLAILTLANYTRVAVKHLAEGSTAAEKTDDL